MHTHKIRVYKIALNSRQNESFLRHRLAAIAKMASAEAVGISTQSRERRSCDRPFCMITMGR
jgi:diphthamide synthase subunit DPH2